MIIPLLRLSLSLAFALSWADGDSVPGKRRVRAPRAILPPVEMPILEPRTPRRIDPAYAIAPEPRFAHKPISPELVEFLGKNGFRVEPTGEIVRERDAGALTRELLSQAGIEVDEQGRLLYRDGVEIERARLVELLDGLLAFAAIQGLSTRDVGRALQAMGIPPAFDGIHLLNPDGSATYFGLMLFQGLREKPERAQTLSSERLAGALDHFSAAFGQAFHNSAPELAHEHLRRAWDFLSERLEAGETPLRLAPYADMGATLAMHREALERALAAARAPGGDEAYAARLEAAIETFERHQRYRHHRAADLQSPVDHAHDDPIARIEPEERIAPIPRFIFGDSPPQHGALPKILGTLEAALGRPLSYDELRSWVQSFPLGETAWRGIGPAIWEEVWKRGLTGKGVKIGVIDVGVAVHPELSAAVKARENFLPHRMMAGTHPTSVAGVLHALAPEAEIRSYQAMSPEERNKLRQPSLGQIQEATAKAIDKAVADGNHIINLSIGIRPGSPTDPLVKQINRYASQGVIFVISAGNQAGDVMNSLTLANSAYSSGALNIHGRNVHFTSHGLAFDQEVNKLDAKVIWMTPGDNLATTVAGHMPGERTYDRQSGTSFSSPYLGGYLSWLVQGMNETNGAINPIELSGKLQAAIAQTTRSIPRNELPSNVDPAQKFLIVDPVAACKRLNVCREPRG